MQARRKIGLLGGTFDPPHKGHLNIAKEALQQLALDEVWLIPTYEPPHKEGAATSGCDRLKMVERMIEPYDCLKVKSIELERKGKSYTIDTINTLKKRYPDVSFYFIIGADQVNTLDQWYRIEDLVKKVTFVGVERPGVLWEEKLPVQKIQAIHMDVSSTEVRQKIKEAKSVDGLIEPSVYAYIKEKQLYGYRKVEKGS